MIAWMSDSGGGEHATEHANELLFAPIWFGVIAAVVFLLLLGLLWMFRNTLALDPHTEESASPDAAYGERSSDGGSASAQGRASQH